VDVAIELNYMNLRILANKLIPGWKQWAYNTIYCKVTTRHGYMRT